MSPNSVCNHTRDRQSRPILLITHIITDRIGLRMVLSPLLIGKNKHLTNSLSRIFYYIH